MCFPFSSFSVVSNCFEVTGFDPSFSVMSSAYFEELWFPFVFEYYNLHGSCKQKKDLIFAHGSSPSRPEEINI